MHFGNKRAEESIARLRDHLYASRGRNRDPRSHAPAPSPSRRDPGRPPPPNRIELSSLVSDDAGREIGNRSVVADAGGNWIASFP